MDEQRHQLVEKLKAANNILVTVSSNPSVDQLSSAIGLTILLNKLKKHATAVFSGNVPSTLEFLKPEDTLEKNTDSLRDFIISLDKAKADKLRYKVEENVVKIFITPYKTSISEADLDFSQGDFNVDVVVALGVSEQQDLDQAITAHGRILHDAIVTTVNTHPGGELGSINFIDPAASSLSELVTELADTLGKDLIDGQIATALLTGIVAETDRFSNEKTTPNTMRLSAELLTAGANQQLVASSLETAPEPVLTQGNDNNSDNNLPSGSNEPPAKGDDGTLEISHPMVDEAEPLETAPAPESAQVSEQPPLPSLLEEPHISDVKQTNFDVNASDGISLLPPSQLPPQHYMTEPPLAGGLMTANTQPEDLVEESRDPFGILLPEEPNATQQPHAIAPPVEVPAPQAPASAPVPLTPVTPAVPVTPWQPESSSAPAQDDVPSMGASYVPLPSEPSPSPIPQSIPSTDPSTMTTLPSLPTPIPTDTPAPQENDETLADIEQLVHSPHAATLPTSDNTYAQPQQEPALAPDPMSPPPDVDAARDAVMSAINSAPQNEPLPPKADVGASGYLNVQDLPGVDDGLPAQMPSLTVPPLSPIDPASTAASPADRPVDMPMPQSSSMQSNFSPLQPTPLTTPVPSQSAPPPVPPPMTEMPPFTPQQP